jgi:hypothetical protein
MAAKAKARCMVCRLENHWKKTLGENNLTKNVAMCSCCRVYAHYCVPIDSQKWQIHKLDRFQNMSCFEIMHTKVGYEIWMRCPDGLNIKKHIYPKQDQEVIKQQLKRFYNVEHHGIHRRQQNNGT